MTLLSVADCCRHLGIDPKTLRRWLAQAHLPLQRHPTDGRKQGLSEEHLRELSQLHHRALPALPHEAQPLPTTSTATTLPTAVLALPERLDALQQQLSVLQEQLTALTHALGAHPAASAVPATATRQSKAVPKPARAPARPPRKPTHVIARVESGSQGQYVVICPKQGLLALEPDSHAWFTWLATQSSFRFVGTQGHFTAHHEVQRVPNGAWRAHRHIRNQSYTLRLAPTGDLTIAVLEQAAATLQAHLN